jgi:hypothetical protein
MQIHELTQKQLDEGLMDVAKGAASGLAQAKDAIGTGIGAVTQPFKDVAGAYKDVRQDAKIAATADKAYNAWTKFSDQVAKAITDPVKKQAYLSRTDGRYEKDLLSFVQQNLLRGMSFSTLNNRDDIMGLIKAISKATADSVTPPPPAKNPYNNQTAGGQATTTAQGQPVKPGTVPNTASPLAQARAAVKKPGTPPAAPTAVKEAVDPAQVKQLFAQLVQQAALAQQSVYTGAQAQQQAQQQQPAGAVDPKQVAAQLSKVLSAAGLDTGALSTAGQAIQAASGGNNNVRSTGNPLADALLKQMGFSI